MTDQIAGELADLELRERAVQRAMRQHEIEPEAAEAVLRQIWRRERELMAGVPYGNARRRKAVLKDSVTDLVDNHTVRPGPNVTFGPLRATRTADGKRWMSVETSPVID